MAKTKVQNPKKEQELSIEQNPSEQSGLDTEKEQEFKQDTNKLYAINKEKFSVKDATNETISKMEKTLSHLEDTYFTEEADPKIASVLLAGYEKILKLKTTKEVGEGSMDISIIVAKFNADVKKNPQMFESLKEDIINAELCE